MTPSEPIVFVENCIDLPEAGKCSFRPVGISKPEESHR
jgi:hypothetical protein